MFHGMEGKGESERMPCDLDERMDSGVQGCCGKSSLSRPELQGVLTGVRGGSGPSVWSRASAELLAWSFSRRQSESDSGGVRGRARGSEGVLREREAAPAGVFVIVGLR